MELASCCDSCMENVAPQCHPSSTVICAGSLIPNGEHPQEFTCQSSRLGSKANALRVCMMLICETMGMIRT
eukprot:3576111-Amphidinium_carterae.1